MSGSSDQVISVCADQPPDQVMISRLSASFHSNFASR
jgi:hypothetical protein